MGLAQQRSPDAATVPPDVERTGRIVEPERLPDDVRARLEQSLGPDVVVVQGQHTVHSGPLPPPDVLRGYADLIPDAPQRFLAMAERSLEHGISTERRADDRAAKGLWMGFAALLFLIVGALAAVFVGNTAAVGIFLGTAAVGVIGRFLPHLGSVSKDED